MTPRRVVQHASGWYFHACCIITACIVMGVRARRDGCGCDRPTGCDLPPLLTAVESSNVEAVRQLIKTGALEALRVRDVNNSTALHCAILSDKDAVFNDADTEIVSLLLNSPAGPWLRRARGENNLTALHMAVIFGHLPVLELLLSDTGDELHEPDTYGNTVFHFAATSTRHSLDVYDLLLQRYGTGESVHSLWERALTARGYRQQTPLHVAVADNNVDVVQLLLQLFTQLSELEWTSRLLGNT